MICEKDRFEVGDERERELWMMREEIYME